MIRPSLRCTLTFVLAAGCAWAETGPMTIRDAALALEFDSTLRSRVLDLRSGQAVPLGPFTASETLEAGGRRIQDFPCSSRTEERVQDTFGAGRKLVLEGRAGDLAKQVSVTLYDAFPGVAVFTVAYTNRGTAPLKVQGWRSNAYTLDARPGSGKMPFWAYLSGASSARLNWLRPLKVGFQLDNYQGMIDTDYGGGTPVADVWTASGGLAVGHLETGPRLVALPVARPDQAHATLAVQAQAPRTLAPGETFQTLRTFTAVHAGDCFQPLGTYAKLMGLQGFTMQKAPESAFGSMWCAWGYGRKVVPSQVYGTLPTAKSMGFKWVTYDDGWQDTYGDWNLNPAKFPGGDADMKAIVDRIHKDGFLAQLWWCPLAAVANSKLLKNEPELALLNADGSRRKITWWNAFYLCPADPKVKAYQQKIVHKIMKEWGFDGLKLDGQHMNAAPLCYNPAHHHERPEASMEAMPEFFKGILEAAKAVNPEALVEFCPCGTTYSFFTMPYYNLSVAADPNSSFQVRSKGKVIKALMGDGVPYFGDHVELTESHLDFASTLAVGGVAGTQFALPALVLKPGVFDLTPARDRHFRKWIALYQEKMLSKGTYLGGLYTQGFDLPEGHAVRKDGGLYYGFFAKTWKGPIQLRGLEDREYRVRDYVNGKDLGTVRGPSATLDTTFREHLLLEAKPI